MSQTQEQRIKDYEEKLKKEKLQESPVRYLGFQTPVGCKAAPVPEEEPEVVNKREERLKLRTFKADNTEMQTESNIAYEQVAKPSRPVYRPATPIKVTPVRTRSPAGRVSPIKKESPKRNTTKDIELNESPQK